MKMSGNWTIYYIFVFKYFRLAEMESGVAGAAHFTALHIGAQLLAHRIGKMDQVQLPAQTHHSLINELLHHCAK